MEITIKEFQPRPAMTKEEFANRCTHENQEMTIKNGRIEYIYCPDCGWNQGS